MSKVLSVIGREVSGILISGCTVYTVYSQLLQVSQTQGPSMHPTISQRGEVVLVDKTKMGIKAGDVVVGTSPTDPTKSICKRIKGMEGDIIAYTAGLATKELEVPAGHVWLQGDNQFNSTDSRHYGPVPYALLQGRVFYRVWPLSRMGWIE